MGVSWCQGPLSKQDKQQVIIDHSSDIDEEFDGPEICEQIKENIFELKPFEKEMPKRKIKLQLNDETYIGEVDWKNRPDGYGRMYKSDGSLFIGKFKDGAIKDNHKAYYFYPDGSYYYGEFKDNEAYDKQGEYVDHDFKYIGEIKHNKFHGHGTEKSSIYTFQGEFKDDKRVKGSLEWYQNDHKYNYIGTFNYDELFQGRGELHEPTGIYTGEFKNGKKHGHGEYKFNNHLKYIGEYFNGIKKGYGKIYSADSKISYEGQWKYGLPNGKGTIYKPNGDKIQGNFFEGVEVKCIDKTLLSQRIQKLEDSHRHQDSDHNSSIVYDPE